MNLTFEKAQAAYLTSITKVFDDIAPRPDWLIQFATGEPGPVLVRQSRDAQLLVVEPGSTLDSAGSWSDPSATTV
jgi:hypothetical protein